uniref:Uncharacterized protein n=1 Tax=Meleagris gallopavo TaxID=9103 RepID=G1N9Y7_MELGA
MARAQPQSSCFHRKGPLQAQSREQSWVPGQREKGAGFGQVSDSCRPGPAAYWRHSRCKLKEQEQTKNRTELLCEASAIILESQHCHKNLQGLFLNVRQLLNSTSLKAPCPVTAGNTTSMEKFLSDLHRLLQQLVKEKFFSS